MKNRRVTTQANKIVALADRAREWKERLRLIREARRFLHVSTYFVSCDPYGTFFLRELIRAQKRGVGVRLLIDSFGQKLANSGLITSAGRRELEELFGELSRYGGEVSFYEPHHAIEKICGSGNHVKIQLNDRGEGIFGSSNLSALSFESWEEFSVLLHGPVVETLEETFSELWGRENPPVSARTPENQGSRSNPGTALEFFCSNPCENSGPLGPFKQNVRNLVTRTLAEAIDAAKKTVDIATLYFKPHRDLLKAVIRAAKRGVRVRVIHSHKNSIPTTELPWLPSFLKYRELLKSGVEIYEQHPGQHAKIVFVDGKWAAFGSYNFEHAADDRLAEAMIATRAPEILESIADFLESSFGNPGTEKVTRQKIKGLPWNLKLKSFVFSPAYRWI